MKARKVVELLRAQQASDGDGVKLMRVFGGTGLERFDPFLMMDEFGSDSPGDYMGGFPSHPHRGFETITYMLEGHMEHKDHMGNIGDLQKGDVQWMTAGSGIIHSEMPKQTQGRLRGFQVWLNLPARDKMQAPSYRDIAAAEIPTYQDGTVQIKAIAGTLKTAASELAGAVTNAGTEPGYLDISFPAEPQTRSLSVPDGHTVLLYVYEGEVQVGDDRTTVGKSQLARLSVSGDIKLESSGAARMILLTGRPLQEPIVHYGPFVMNTREQIEQALRDYRAGTLTH
jgi:redox-sensitive bicupin YhaK (pirin superfamily)